MVPDDTVGHLGGGMRLLRSKYSHPKSVATKPSGKLVAPSLPYTLIPLDVAIATRVLIQLSQNAPRWPVPYPVLSAAGSLVRRIGMF